MRPRVRGLPDTADRATRAGGRWWCHAAWFGGLSLVTAPPAGLAETASPPSDPPHLLAPWVIEARADNTSSQAARGWPARWVLDSSSQAQRSVATLAEALRWTPGLLLQESFGGFEPPRLSIRGSGLDSAPSSRGVAWLIDDLPLHRADGTFLSALFDPQLFGRVEVARGSLHAADAPAALGGVIQAYSNAVAAARTGEGRVEFGSFGRVHGRAELRSGPLRLAASGVRSEGWRPHSGQARTVVTGSWIHSGRSGRTFALSAYVAGARYEVPGPLTLAHAQTDPDSVSSAVERDQPRRHSELARLAGRYEWQQPDHVLRGAVSLQRSRDFFVQLQGNGILDNGSDDVALSTTLIRHLPRSAHEHQLLIRATLAVGTVKETRFLNERGERGERFAAYRASARTGSLSLEDIMTVRPNLSLRAGVTLAEAFREVDRHFPQTEGPDAFDRALRSAAASPRVSCLWQVRDGLVLQAAASRGFEPPTTGDLLSIAGTAPNLTLRSRPLNAQRATTFEAGIRARRQLFDSDLVVYHSYWYNEILRLADAAGQPRGAANANRTRHVGLEATGSYRPFGDAHPLTARATLTLAHFHFDQDPVYGDNRLAGAPSHAGAVEVVYQRPRGALAALEATWLGGRIPADHAGRLHYDGDVLVHARLGYEWGARCTVIVSVRNLFDQTHVASTAGVLDVARSPATTAIFLPGAPRSFNVGLEWRF